MTNTTHLSSFISQIISPAAHTSHMELYSLRTRISGARYHSVTTSGVREPSKPEACVRPKSAILRCKWWSIRMLSGLMSRCTMRLMCMQSMPSRSCRAKCWKEKYAYFWRWCFDVSQSLWSNGMQNGSQLQAHPRAVLKELCDTIANPRSNLSQSFVTQRPRQASLG